MRPATASKRAALISISILHSLKRRIASPNSPLAGLKRRAVQLATLSRNVRRQHDVLRTCSIRSRFWLFCLIVYQVCIFVWRFPSMIPGVDFLPSKRTAPRRFRVGAETRTLGSINRANSICALSAHGWRRVAPKATILARLWCVRPVPGR